MDDLDQTINTRILSLAVIGQAVEDTAHSRYPDVRLDAQIWLLFLAPEFFDYLGLDLDRGWWKNWVLAGCPGKRLIKNAVKLGRPRSKESSRVPYGEIFGVRRGNLRGRFRKIG